MVNNNSVESKMQNATTLFHKSQNARPRIAFVDSGIGGIPYIDALHRKHQYFDLHYVCDTKGFPYGKRSGDYLRAHSSALLARIMQVIDPDCIVLACNTLSLTCLSYLRAQCSVPIVGVVPAIKRAIDDEKQRIYVMSTINTAQSDETKKLIRRHKRDNQRVFMRAYSELVEYIERYVLNQEDAYWAYIASILSHLINDLETLKTDALILGCTHFVHCKHHIVRDCPRNIRVYDSVDGVVRRINDMFSIRAHDKGMHKKSILFYCTDDSNEALYREFVKRHAMEYSTPLVIKESDLVN